MISVLLLMIQDVSRSKLESVFKMFIAIIIDLFIKEFSNFIFMNDSSLELKRFHHNC